MPGSVLTIGRMQSLCSGPSVHEADGSGCRMLSIEGETLKGSKNELVGPWVLFVKSPDDTEVETRMRR